MANEEFAADIDINAYIVGNADVAGIAAIMDIAFKRSNYVLGLLLLL